jgi:nickel-dependent lactate racemase
VTKEAGGVTAYVNYEGRRVEFDLPKGWNLISGQDRPPAPVVKDPEAEIATALDHPIGSPKIEDLARAGMEAVLLFDDLQRPHPPIWCFRGSWIA